VYESTDEKYLTETTPSQNGVAFYNNKIKKCITDSDYALTDIIMDFGSCQPKTKFRKKIKIKQN